MHKTLTLSLIIWSTCSFTCDDPYINHVLRLTSYQKMTSDELSNQKTKVEQAKNRSRLRLATCCVLGLGACLCSCAHCTSEGAFGVSLGSVTLATTSFLWHRMNKEMLDKENQEIDALLPLRGKAHCFKEKDALEKKNQ